MEDKKKMKLFVFGIIAIMAVLVFWFLMTNMYEVGGDNPSSENTSGSTSQTSGSSTESSSQTSTSSEEENTETFTYDFENIKLEEICDITVDSCNSLISTITNNNKTSLLYFSYTNGVLKDNSKYSLLIDDKEIEDEDGDDEFPYEFTGFNNKYILMILKDKTGNKEIKIIDYKGEEIMDDDIMADVKLNKDSITYETRVSNVTIKIEDNKLERIEERK